MSLTLKSMIIQIVLVLCHLLLHLPLHHQQHRMLTSSNNKRYLLQQLLNNKMQDLRLISIIHHHRQFKLNLVIHPVECLLNTRLLLQCSKDLLLSLLRDHFQIILWEAHNNKHPLRRSRISTCNRRPDMIPTIMHNLANKISIGRIKHQTFLRILHNILIKFQDLMELLRALQDICNSNH